MPVRTPLRRWADLSEERRQQAFACYPRAVEFASIAARKHGISGEEALDRCLDAIGSAAANYDESFGLTLDQWVEQRLKFIVADHFRRSSRQKQSVRNLSSILAASDSADPSDEADSASRLALARIGVKAMLDTLPGKQGEVVSLWASGHTFAEIGHRLGFTREWVRQIHGRAMKTLRELADHPELRPVLLEAIGVAEDTEDSP